VGKLVVRVTVLGALLFTATMAEGAPASWTGGDAAGFQIWDYVYYPSGELFRFRYRKDGYDLQAESRSPFEWFEEIFAQQGTLAGCGYASRGGAAKTAFAGYWLGREVNHREFQDRTTQAERALQ